MTEQEKIIGEGLAYEDVLIVPGSSDIRSRYGNQMDTSTQVAVGLPSIKLGIISANMDTVTESRMAATMASEGGLGIIHRFMPPENQAQEVRLVKERTRVIEESPPIISESATVTDALNLLNTRNRGYVMVHAGATFDSNFIGIATTRDFLSGSPDDPITHVMTPRKNIITVPNGTTLEEAVQIMKKSKVEKIPVVDTKGLLVGVYSLKDYQSLQEHPHASLDKFGRLMVGAAIGVKKSDIERAHMLVDAGADVLVIDIAHGQLVYVPEMLHTLKVKERITTPIITGNYATGEGVLAAYENGADGVKVGVGAGWVCKTRNIAGVGMPQITAIMEAAKALANKQNGIPIIADGGIREEGDYAKAIVAGANTIMIGSLFAGTEESPGEPVLVDGVLKKMVRGMASADAFADRQKLGDTTTVANRYVPEGRTTLTPYKGSVTKILYSFDGGLRSGLSYVGAHTIIEMQRIGRFTRVTGAGATENHRPLR